jgi:hypothetical protein
MTVHEQFHMRLGDKMLTKHISAGQIKAPELCLTGRRMGWPKRQTFLSRQFASWNADHIASAIDHARYSKFPEEAGIEFLDADGVRRRDEEIIVYRGALEERTSLGIFMKRPEKQEATSRWSIRPMAF